MTFVNSSTSSRTWAYPEWPNYNWPLWDADCSLYFYSGNYFDASSVAGDGSPPVITRFDTAGNLLNTYAVDLTSPDGLYDGLFGFTIRDGQIIAYGPNYDDGSVGAYIAIDIETGVQSPRALLEGQEGTFGEDSVSIAAGIFSTCNVCGDARPSFFHVQVM